MSRVQTSALVAAAASLVAAGWFGHAWWMRPDAGAVASADSLAAVVDDSDQRTAPRLESAPRIVAGAVRGQAAAAVHRDSAKALGQAARMIQDSLACTDTTLLRQLGELHAGEVAQLDSAYEKQRSAADSLLGVVRFALDTVVPERTAQRDEALRQLRSAVRRPAPASTLRLVVTGASCAASTYAAARGSQTVALISGGACAVSLLEKPLRSLLRSLLPF